MTRCIRFVAPLLLCLVLAVPASAQTPRITPGQDVSGRLDRSDPQLGDRSHYDDYVYTARAGERLVITMRSRDFDAYLIWGRRDGAEFSRIATDDDGAGGTDARIEVTVSEAGTYVIRANSLGAERTGAYTLAVTSAGGKPAVPAAEPARRETELPFVLIGAPINERLGPDDPRLDGAHYRIYQTHASAGDRLVIRLTSPDFDTYLSWGRGGADFTEHDDDGGDGTNSRLTVTVRETGVHRIRVKSYGQGGTGRFELRVERAAEPAAAPPRSPPARTPPPAPTRREAEPTPPECRPFVDLDWTPQNLNSRDRAAILQWSRCVQRAHRYTVAHDATMQVATERRGEMESWSYADIDLPRGVYTLTFLGERHLRRLEYSLEGQGESGDRIKWNLTHWLIETDRSLTGGRYRLWLRADGVYTHETVSVLIVRVR